MVLTVLLVATILVVATCAIHLAGLVALSAVMRRRRAHPIHLETVVGQGASIMVYVLSIFILHSVQIWVYVIGYYAVGAFSDLQDMLYYSITSFTTVGYGDLIPKAPWRLLGAIESANGFLLIGWSTAFLVSLTNKIRLFEATLEQGVSEKNASAHSE